MVIEQNHKNLQILTIYFKKSLKVITISHYREYLKIYFLTFFKHIKSQTEA